MSSSFPALAIQPAKTENFLDQYSKAMQLKNIMQRAKIGNIELGQAQRQESDRKTFSKAYLEAQGDPIKTKELAIQYGTSPEFVGAWEKQVIAAQDEQRKKSKEDREMELANSERIAQVAGAVLRQPPEKRPAMYSFGLGMLKQQGIIKGNQVPEQYPGDDALKIIALSAIKNVDQLKAFPVTEKKYFQPGTIEFDPTTGATKQIGEPKAAPLSDMEQRIQDGLVEAGMANTPGNRHMMYLKLKKEEREAGKEPDVVPKTNAARNDRSYQFNSTLLDKIEQPISQLVQRMGRLVDTVEQNTPQADALVAPELLTVMAGGMGSGLRMNEAEIARIIGGRSKWETLQAAINKWKLDPKEAVSITPDQRQQIRALVRTVQEKVNAKQQILEDARNRLANAESPEGHRLIVNKARKLLNAQDQGGNTTSGLEQSIPKVGTIKGGYKFKGGDPSDKNNWVKQ